jgi:cell division protein FtsL
MAQAARAYQEQIQPQWRQAPAPAPRFRVLPGNGQDAAQRQSLSPQVLFLFKLVLATMIFVACLGGLRVWITTATVQELIESQSIIQAISEARATGMELEVKHSVLANPNRIQEIASEQLGMSPAAQVAYLDAATAK